MSASRTVALLLPLGLSLAALLVFGDVPAAARRGDVAAARDLPVDAAALEARPEVATGIRNLIAPASLQTALSSGEGGLTLDLGALGPLLDGSVADPAAIYGTVHAGPYPFEAAEARFAYKRFRTGARVREGRALIRVGGLLRGRANSEDWTDAGQIALRLDLHEETDGIDRPLGRYDTFAWFAVRGDSVIKLPGVVEGPLLNLATSDDPGRVVISLRTDMAVPAVLELSDGRRVASPAGLVHEIAVDGLAPDTDYAYAVRVGDLRTRRYRFRSAPRPGEGDLRFAYCGDSREGVGGGRLRQMGVNALTIEMHAATAFTRGARLFVMGGDLINGFTSSPEDFATQLHMWKQAMAGFWGERPVFTAMGNHEALLRAFSPPKGERPAHIDRWPYATESAEGVFAAAFVNPANGPVPADPRRPSYGENVYSFRYGPMLMIVFNNNYWYSTHAGTYGGAPEGYVMDDQLDWIEAELARAEADPAVRCVFLCAQEPVFPNGGHVWDAMWYGGDNNVRAHTWTEGRLVPAARGIVEVRNRLALAVARSSKVAAVLGGDEHAYNRVLIDAEVPVGVPALDDRDGDGRIAWDGAEPASPLAGLERPVWYVICGGGGAPYYAEEPTPWNRYWLERGEEPARYAYSSQENLLLFDCGADGSVAMEVVNQFGETIDRVDDLMAVKSGR